MKIKTSELTGTALDWAVAKCEDLHTGYPGYWSNSVLEAAFLIAAMRAFVASKLGDEIEVPDEL